MAKSTERTAKAPLLPDVINSRPVSGIAPRKARKRGDSSTGDDHRLSNSEEGSNTSSLSANEPVEMDDIDSDFGDEEQGLTSGDKRRQAQRRIHSHDADDVPLTTREKRLADRAVIQKIIVNVILILLWYIFATSISVVSIQILGHLLRHNSDTLSSSTINGCFRRIDLTSIFLCSLLPFICLSNLGLQAPSSTSSHIYGPRKIRKDTQRHQRAYQSHLKNP